MLSMKRQRTSPGERSADSEEASTSITDVLPPFDMLSEDNVVLRIFSCIGNGIQCFRTLSPVCKRFRSLMRNTTLWESQIHIGLTLSPRSLLLTDLRTLVPDLAKFPVKSLRLTVPGDIHSSVLSSSNTKHLFSLRSTLQLLQIDYNDCMSPIAVLVGNLTGLTKLSLRCDNMFDPEYSLGPYSYQHIIDLQEELTKLKLIESLTLHEIPIMQTTLHSILSSCPLKSFEFSIFQEFTIHYDLQGLMVAISHATQLTHLTIHGHMSTSLTSL
mmetsp:Transcript_38883/g.64725  ORF Transcript_38883/g.64725 Transcript_38883/m.64725 type:complete len:271 (-) Transcript_38883:624-1436(-)